MREAGASDQQAHKATVARLSTRCGPAGLGLPFPAEGTKTHTGVCRTLQAAGASAALMASGRLSRA